MPAKDQFHEAVKNALVKEGWTITDDPLFLKFGEVDMYVGLGAEKVISAWKDGQKIAVEVKSFIQPSLISEFHTAVGQFINYRVSLEETEPERILYLAVTEDAYKTFFTLLFTRTVVEKNQLKIIIYNPNEEVIVEWKN